MSDSDNTGQCRITIWVRDDGLPHLLEALPLDFRILQLPPHPDNPAGPGWRLDYQGTRTMDQDDTLDSFDVDIVTSWGRAGLPLRTRKTTNE